MKSQVTAPVVEFFERCNITAPTDMLEAVKMAEESLKRAHAEDSSQSTLQIKRRPN
jgi:hypothetical protein